MGLILAGSVQAQVSISLNLGAPPQWGPVGYSDAHYYYLPDVEAYYDVQSSMFIYLNAGRWVHRSSLPVRYRNYDLYHGYKVVLSDYRGNSPYSQFREHKVKYARGFHGQDQRSIGNRPEHGRPESYAPAGKRTSGRENQQGNGNQFRGESKKMNKENGNGHGNGKKK